MPTVYISIATYVYITYVHVTLYDCTMYIRMCKAIVRISCLYIYKATCVYVWHVLCIFMHVHIYVPIVTNLAALELMFFFANQMNFS